MRAIAEIEADLAAVTAKQSELVSNRDRLEISVEDLERKYIRNGATAEDLESERMRLEATKNTISSFKARKSDLEAELRDAQQEDHNANSQNRLKDLIVSGRQAYDAYYEAYAELETLIDTAAAKLFEHRRTFEIAKRSAKAYSKSGSPIDAVADADDFAIVNARYITAPASHWASEIATIEGTYGNRMERRARS